MRLLLTFRSGSELRPGGVDNGDSAHYSKLPDPCIYLPDGICRRGSVDSVPDELQFNSTTKVAGCRATWPKVTAV